MNNFGVIEVANIATKATPGWAYVPDTGPSVPNLQPANRKRAARNLPGLSLPDLTARQENKLRKDLEALNRDNGRDVNIPIPPRPGGSRAQNKHTPNVRKILQSQKTFANHLDDYAAMLALAESNPAAAAAMSAAQTKASTPATAKSASPAPPPPTAAAAAATAAETIPAGTSKRSAAAAKRAANKEREEERKRAKLAAAQEAAAAKAKAETEPALGSEDVDMVDAEQQQQQQQQEQEQQQQQQPEAAPQEQVVKDQPPQSYPPDGTILPAYKKPPPAAHPGDNDPLLVSVVPPFPSDEELRALMTAPPLNYFESRATWGDDETRYPIRVFCEICGYWGRVKCMKCGVRVCALDCLETHREECVTRYGL